MRANQEQKVQHANRNTSFYAFEWEAEKADYNAIRHAAMRGKFSPAFQYIWPEKQDGIGKIRFSFSTPSNNFLAEVTCVSTQLSYIIDPGSTTWFELLKGACTTKVKGFNAPKD